LDGTGTDGPRDDQFQHLLYRPDVLALVGGISVFAEKRYFPLAAQALGLFQSLKILPAAIATLIKPHGLIFKVTPRRRKRRGRIRRRYFLGLGDHVAAHFFGLIINSSAELRIVRQAALVPLSPSGAASISCCCSLSACCACSFGAPRENASI